MREGNRKREGRRQEENGEYNFQAMFFLCLLLILVRPCPHSSFVFANLFVFSRRQGGEDLRLDQRVQQLFGLMNEILHQDTECMQRHLALRRYQVIPMTPRLGIIEWMSNTTVLKDLIASRSRKKKEKKRKRK